jgi:hypothetical protein
MREECILSGAEEAAEKVANERKACPQGLKPDVFSSTCGTAKAMP